MVITYLLIFVYDYFCCLQCVLYLLLFVVIWFCHNLLSVVLPAPSLGAGSILFRLPVQLLICPSMHAFFVNTEFHKLLEWISSNLQEIAEIRLFVYFPGGGCLPYWICYSPFWTTQDLPRDGLYLPLNGVMVQSDVKEILWFYDFTNLAGKYLFTRFLSCFWAGQRWCNVDRNDLILSFWVFYLSATFCEIW